MAFDFELSFTGLCVVTFKGTDKRKPEEVNVLLVKTETASEVAMDHHHAGGNGHDPSHTHFGRLSFSPANLFDKNFDRNAYKVAPLPSGEQIGIMDLNGQISVSPHPGDPGAQPDLSAMWRPSGRPMPLSPSEIKTDEQEWLNWVPNLETVDPGIKAPADNALLPGVQDGKVIAQVRLTRGELKAAKPGRGPDGKILVFQFKPAVTNNGAKFVTQAIAEFVVLRLSNLTQPVEFEGIADFSLIGRPGEVVQASITNLPEFGIQPEKRLVHLAQVFPLVGVNKSSDDLNLPESPQIADTSLGAICPCATLAEVPK